METSQISCYNFCLFCYKTFETSVEIPESSHIIQKFINQLSRHVINHKTNVSMVPPVLLNKLSDVNNNLLNCCVKCKDLIVTFCEKYEQLKILEIELGWKLDKLVEEINHADVLPTRWMHVDKVLEQVFQSDLEKKCGNYNVIKKLRQFIVDSGNQNRKQSIPRVLLKRNQKINGQVMKMGNERRSQTRKPGRSEQTKNSQVNVEHYRKRKVCPKCGKKLKSTKGFNHHIETHKDPSEWKFACDHCGKKVPTKEVLRIHLRLHTGEMPYKCGFCPMKYHVRNSLTFHLKNAHGDEEGLQKELRKKITAQSTENTHDENGVTTTENMMKREENDDVMLMILPLKEELDVDIHPNEESSCPPAANFTEVMFTNEPLNNGKTLEDPLHEDTRNDLNEYLTKRFVCDYCNDRFQYNSLLARHIGKYHSTKTQRSEKVKRPGIIGVEDAQDLGTSNTDNDILNSTSSCRDTITTAALECEICTKKFSCLLLKERHFKVCHDLKGNPGKKIIKCTEIGCTAYFLKNTQLRFHRKLEHGKKIDKSDQKYTRCFGCPICGKIYPSQRLFKGHMLSHKDPSEWDFECETCGRKFMSVRNLRLHLRTHTKERKYECKFCGNKFKFARSLGTHMRNFHGDEEEVKADIAVKRSKKEKKDKEEAGMEIEGTPVAEEEADDKNIPADLVEIEMKMGGDMDVIEGDDVHEVMDLRDVDINVDLEENMKSYDDGSFVNLEDIY